MCREGRGVSPTTHVCVGITCWGGCCSLFAGSSTAVGRLCSGCARRRRQRQRQRRPTRPPRGHHSSRHKQAEEREKAPPPPAAAVRRGGHSPRGLFGAALLFFVVVSCSGKATLTLLWALRASAASSTADRPSMRHPPLNPHDATNEWGRACFASPGRAHRRRGKQASHPRLLTDPSRVGRPPRSILEEATSRPCLSYVICTWTADPTTDGSRKQIKKRQWWRRRRSILVFSLFPSFRLVVMCAASVSRALSSNV